MTSHLETNRKIKDFTRLPDCLQFKCDIKVLSDCYSSCFCIFASPDINTALELITSKLKRRIPSMSVFVRLNHCGEGSK